MWHATTGSGDLEQTAQKVTGVEPVELPGRLTDRTEDPRSASPGVQGERTNSYPWTEHEDEASGQPWWRNDETGDETWVRPF